MHERGIAHIVIAVSVTEPAGLHKLHPGLGVLGTARGDIGVLKDAEDLQHAHPARRRRRRTDHIGAIGPAEGLLGLGPIARQVGDRQRAGARLLAGLGDDGPRDLAGGEGGRPFGGDAADGGGVSGVLEEVPGLVDAAVRLGEEGDGVRRLPELHEEADHLGEARADGEALISQPLGVAEQLAPRQAAVRLLRHGQHVDGAERARGAARQHAYEVAERLAVRPFEHLRRGACGRGLTAIVGGRPLRLRVVIEHEGAAPETGALRLHEAQHRLHGHRRVRCAAAGLQHLHPRLHRQGIGRGHHGVGREGLAGGQHRRLGPCRTCPEAPAYDR